VNRAYLLAGPLILLLSCVATALAQDPASVTIPTSPPSLDHLLALGPYGALVWGAYLLGKGVKVTVQVELSERDREAIGKMGAKGGAA
jgi:hypothetical protein